MIGGSVLIHSLDGNGLCVVVTCAYLMKRFRWSFFKALEFLHFRRQGIDLHSN